MTRRQRTKRGAAHWPLALLVALVGAITLFAGAALPAAAADPPSGTCTFGLASYTGSPGQYLTVSVKRTVAGHAGKATVHVDNWTAVFGGSNVDQTFNFLTDDTTVSATWLISSNAIPGTQATLSFTTPTDCTGSGTSTVTVSGTPPATPTISSLSPNHGVASDSIDILGSGFTGTTDVHWGALDLPDDDFTVVNDGKITIASVPNGTGTVDVSVTAPGGTSATKPFTYDTAQGPNITSLFYTSAPAGTNNNIYGTNLKPAGVTNCGPTGDVHVYYGTIEAQCTAQSATVIYSQVPSGQTGTVLVTVKTAYGTSNGLQFTYGSTSTGAPDISYVTPTSGPVGTTLNIYGTNFQLTQSVTVGGVDCPVNGSGSGTHIACVTQGNVTAGVAQPVTVNTNNGNDTLYSAFTYTNSSTVTVTDVQPTSAR